MKALLFILCIALVPGGALLAEFKNEAALPYTTNLSDIDEVELLTLDTRGSINNPPIVDTQRLEAAGTKAFLKTWKSQKYAFSFSARCHMPVYGVRFYRKGKLFAYVSVCWKCSNIRVTSHTAKVLQGFDIKTPEAEQLLAIFKSTFPNFKLKED